MKQELPKTLAHRIQYLREKYNISIDKLADMSNVERSLIYNIEEGRETFLSTAIRQRLAKSLKVSSNYLKEVEKAPLKEQIQEEAIQEIKSLIISDPKAEITCPMCNNHLITRIITLRDLEDLPVKHPKASCSKCPFQIK